MAVVVVAGDQVGGGPAQLAVADHAVAHAAFVGEGAHAGQVEPEPQQQALALIVGDRLVAGAAVEHGVVVGPRDVPRMQGKGEGVRGPRWRG